MGRAYGDSLCEIIVFLVSFILELSAVSVPQFEEVLC